MVDAVHERETKGVLETRGKPALDWWLSGESVPAMLLFFGPAIGGGLGLAACYPAEGHSAAASVMVGLGSLAAGSGLGFLFGIPRQPGNGDIASSDSDHGTGVVANANLVEVSDWLTKIIVGLGLVEFERIRLYLAGLATKFAAEIGGKEAQSFAAGLITYFAIVGFVAGYVLTRLVLTRAFSLASVDIRREVQRRVHDAVAPVQEEVAQGIRQATGLASATVDALVNRRGLQPLETMVEKFAPEERDRFLKLWGSDPNKNAFGGAAVADGRELAAEVKPVSGMDDAVCHVHLEVRATPDGPPLEAPITFHLHPTFVPPQVTVVPVNGVAELDRISRGAFTVGVVTDQGGTRLELDLAELAGAPEKFRRS